MCIGPLCPASAYNNTLYLHLSRRKLEKDSEKLMGKAKQLVAGGQKVRCCTALRAPATCHLNTAGL